MTMDDSKEQTVRNSNFQKLFKNNDISSRLCEHESTNNNPSNICIRESTQDGIAACLGRTALRKSGNKVINIFRKIAVRTASNSGKLNGRTPLEFLIGETFDISEYLDFDFYIRLWF